MPTDLPAKQRTRTVRTFLKLCLASSILQSALILTIYWFHLSLPASYLLALVPIAPLCTALFAALRKRAAETNPYVRKAYNRAMIGAGVMMVLTLLLILASFVTKRDLGSAVLNSLFPLCYGSIFAFMLLMPKRMWEGTSLGDQLLPVRNKLLTPTFRRDLSMGVLSLVYIIFGSASDMLFDSYALTGVISYVVALLPILPIFGLIPVYGNYMAEEQDEFQRHLFHQSILWAFFGTVIVASVIGRLQCHALLLPHHPGFFRPYWIVPVFYFLQIETRYVVAYVQARRVSAQEKQEKTGQ